jgi:hypothetical protein
MMMDVLEGRMRRGTVKVVVRLTIPQINVLNQTCKQVCKYFLI